MMLFLIRDYPESETPLGNNEYYLFKYIVSDVLTRMISNDIHSLWKDTAKVTFVI